MDEFVYLAQTKGTDGQWCAAILGGSPVLLSRPSLKLLKHSYGAGIVPMTVRFVRLAGVVIEPELGED